MGIGDRMKKVWNAFVNTEAPVASRYDYSAGQAASWGTVSPSRVMPRYRSERSIISAIYTRISIDVADVVFRHVKLDEQGRYKEDMNSHLNECLTLETNMDQAPRAFRQDLVQTLFDKGVAALVPVDTAVDPETNETFDIFTIRVGEIVTWYPKHVRVSVYNEDKGIREEVVLEKRVVAIVENPLYMVMNEPNSTFQRLSRKLNILDAVDEAAGSGKLDLIIQLPYVIKTEARKQQAQQRRDDIEFQLKGSKYGIAYTDGTEKITQLNRPAENNLLGQIEYLTKELYGHLGITPEVMNGTATEEVMLNYFARTIKPVLDSVTEAMQRSFIGPIGTKNRERILYFKDPFRLVPIGAIAEIADKLTRNEVVTSNELRTLALGMAPASDPRADQLANPNMPQGRGAVAPAAPAAPALEDVDQIMNEVFDGIASDIDNMTKKIGSG